jgi:cytoskeletal protein RodZ
MGELGTRLRETRESRGLTIEDAERDTRISRRYLAALESEQFEIIPAPVYARGFLRSYSQYLGLDPQQTLALFPRDDEGMAAPQGTLRATKENPIPAVSASRPQWQRPTRAGTAPTASSAAPNPRPFAGTAQRPARPPVVVPQTPAEPTIGIDIGVPVPARRLERTTNSSARSALVLAAAALAIAVVLGLAWLISRTGSDSPPGEVGSPAAGQTNTAGQTPAGTALPSVPRGVVPDVIGLSSAEARLLIAGAGYETIESREKSPNVARGNVLDQSPAPGTQLSEGQSVRIRVSDGP